jgi:hypothetical protein
MPSETCSVSEALHGISGAFFAELAPVLAAFTIHSSSAFSFAGEPPIDIGKSLIPGASATPGLPRSADFTDSAGLAEFIQLTLYDRCYAHCFGAPATERSQKITPDTEFVGRLVRSNASRERWDKGWTIHQLGENGQVFVSKGERERVAMPGAFISESVIGRAPQIGDRVSVRAPHETLHAQPGYYFVFGEVLDELADQLSLLRLYFHCDVESAVRLVGDLSRALNAFQVPFQLKTPADPTGYGRTDAAVLYVGARYFGITARIVAQVSTALLLKPTVPLFTKQLWPGIGAAVEPGSGESFGEHRCRLVAEGIVDAWRQGGADVSAKIVAIAARFTTAGLDLARPYLGPSGVDFFDLPRAPALPS